MKSIGKNISNKIVINKSKFITKIYHINDEEEIKNILNDIHIEYKNATHICFAYIINNVKRFNDNGEPNGTAGLPILNALENNDLNYILAVVIRYFGGIKLGAGGLIRAYSNSIVEALKKTSIKELKQFIKLEIILTYDSIKNIDYLLKDEKIIDKEFSEKITYIVLLEIDKYEKIKNELINNSLNIKEKEQLLI